MSPCPPHTSPTIPKTAVSHQGTAPSGFHPGCPCPHPGTQTLPLRQPFVPSWLVWNPLLALSRQALSTRPQPQAVGQAHPAPGRAERAEPKELNPGGGALAGTTSVPA